MDILSHGLWIYALYFRTRHRFSATIFAVLPDLISFGPHLIYSLFFTGFKFGRPHLIPEYVAVGYNFTHSLVMFFIVFGIFYFITREIYWPLGGWLLHILIDIPTHTKEFFPTPFLWPLSEYKVSAIAWSDPMFMIINYGLLSVLYIYLFTKVKKN